MSPLSSIDIPNSRINALNSPIQSINARSGGASIQDETRLLINRMEDLSRRHIGSIDRSFPRSRDADLKSRIQAMDVKFHHVQQAMNEHINVYLNRMKLMAKFFAASKSAHSKHFTYQSILGNVETAKANFQIEHQRNVERLKELSEPDGLIDDVKQKIFTTLQNIGENRKNALTVLQRENISNNPQAASICDLFCETSQIYVDEIRDYLSLVSKSIEGIIFDVQKTVDQSLERYQEHVLTLTTESEAAMNFLDTETKKILEVAEVRQTPLISNGVGISSLIPFDETPFTVHGRIYKMIISQEWHIKGIQCIYLDSTGKEHLGLNHGGHGGARHVIELNPNETIIEASMSSDRAGVDSIEFILFDDQTNCLRKCGPYGQHGYAYLSREKITTFTYGKKYYLGAIKGHEKEGLITSLAFVFFRNFASILKLDLTARIKQTIKILKINPEFALSIALQEQLLKFPQCHVPEEELYSRLMQNPNNRDFVGVKVNGKPEGGGMMTLRDGTAKIGTWKAGKINKSGIVIFPNGQNYVGEWVDGLPHGSGIFRWPDGAIQMMQWTNGKIEGMGALIYPDGQLFAGKWVNGKPDGAGGIEWPDGTIQIWLWEDGIRINQGILISPNGEVYGSHIREGTSLRQMEELRNSWNNMKEGSKDILLKVQGYQAELLALKENLNMFSA